MGGKQLRWPLNYKLIIAAITKRVEEEEQAAAQKSSRDSVILSSSLPTNIIFIQERVWHFSPQKVIRSTLLCIFDIMPQATIEGELRSVWMQEKQYCQYPLRPQLCIESIALR